MVFVTGINEPTRVYSLKSSKLSNGPQGFPDHCPIQLTHQWNCQRGVRVETHDLTVNKKKNSKDNS